MALRKENSNVITRREMNRAFTFMLAAFFSERSAALLQAKALPQQNIQNHMPNMASVAVRTLMQEPLAEMPNPEVTVITLTVAPGAVSPPHKHTGPFFYEPPMHVHRSLRNLSRTKPARLLIFEVGEKGKPFTIGAR